MIDLRSSIQKAPDNHTAYGRRLRTSKTEVTDK